MGVRADYLEAAFAAIDTHWSCFAHFLVEALGINEARRQQLREQLLV